MKSALAAMIVCAPLCANAGVPTKLQCTFPFGFGHPNLAQLTVSQGNVTLMDVSGRRHSVDVIGPYPHDDGFKLSAFWTNGFGDISEIVVFSLTLDRLEYRAAEVTYKTLGDQRVVSSVIPFSAIRCRET